MKAIDDAKKESNVVEPVSNDLLQEAKKYKSAEEFVKKISSKPGKFDDMNYYEEYAPTIKEVIQNKGRKDTPFDGGFDMFRVSNNPELLAPGAEIKDGMIKIYRVSQDGSLLPGDFVTTSKDYIKRHSDLLKKEKGMTNLKVTEKWVKLDDVANPEADVIMGESFGEPLKKDEYFYVPIDAKQQLIDLYNQVKGKK